MARLTCLLGSYPDSKTDEFQVGSMLVWVKYSPEKSRDLQLAEAEELFAEIEEEIPSIADLVTSSLGSSTPATVRGISISPDRSVDYDCTFFDGEYFDQSFFVHREPNGDLLFSRT
jgi:hypothetical protein